MSKRILAIGVGGTGKAALTIMKERLEEAYGLVPDNVVLLSLDTDNLRPEDTFAGSRLTDQFDDRKREPEFRYIVSKPGVTMDTIFADIARERTSAYMHWLEHKKLDLILSPAERDIRGGAQQRRPVGRVAVFQRWDNPIYNSILQGIVRMYGEPEDRANDKLDDVKIEQSKRLIFIIGSVAGGTGSGFLVDIANLVRHVVNSNQKFQSVDVSAVIVLPDAFSSYTTAMNDPTNLKPNSYAALRELDRFIRTHSASLPFMIRYDDDLRSITWNTKQTVDHVYLVDTASPSGAGDTDLSGNPWRGVFPIISDFVMSHVDESLGDSLATLRSNAGQHYNKEEGWQYSSFNLMTYIFPVEDVIKSFSYRFLREMLTRQFLPITDKKQAGSIQQEAIREAEKAFADNSIGGKVNPGVIQKAIACTRELGAEKPDVSWRGLFNMIALSDSSFAQDYQDLDGWLQYLASNLTPTGDGENKRESYDDGYTRLINLSEKFMNDCLGAKYDRDNEDARLGGEWDKILGRYREALRLRFSEALNVQILDVMNRRDPSNKVLRENRLPFARFMVAKLKEKLVDFKEIVKTEYASLNLDERIRRSGDSVREQIAYMQDTKDTETWALLGKPKAYKAQQAYIYDFNEKMELLLHQKVYKIVTDVLDALGAAERDQDNNLSVLDAAALELENWDATFREVDKILADSVRIHEKNREQKRNVKVRRYLTDEKYEEELYRRQEHVGMVANRVLGQVRGETGMVWQRLDENEPSRIKIVTVWTEEAKGPEQIASKFVSGIHSLFQVVRENVTIADRITAMFKSPASFVGTANTVNEPFLRYNPAANGKQMFVERYLSYDVSKAQEDARKFFDDANLSLGTQGVNVVSVAESKVACTILEISRGARLRAVDQFIACEPDYRGKLYRGRESLHLFTEEQIATDYEQNIEVLNEANNRQRFLSPELVVAMGDNSKLRIFTQACAHGLIHPDRYFDPEKGIDTTEIFLSYIRDSKEYRIRLSDSQDVRLTDKRFDNYSADEQKARLYLNALQNFVLKITQKPGVPDGMIPNLVEALKNLGVSFGPIEPFSLPARYVGEAVQAAIKDLGPNENEEPDKKQREKQNAKRRAETLRKFVDTTVCDFKGSPAPRIKDMGTVMHLILRADISQLEEQAIGAKEAK